MKVAKVLLLVFLVLLAGIGSVSAYKMLETRCWEVCDNGVWCVSMGCSGGVPAKEAEKAPVPDEVKPADVPAASPSPVPVPATGLLPKE